MRPGSVFLGTIIAVLFCLGLQAQAEDRLVPSEYATIQAAINDANVGDVVIVAPGVYTGPDNRELDFGGKAITVRSEDSLQPTIIDCENSGRAFKFDSTETTAARVDGFIIRDANAETGAIYCNFGSCTIANCIITASTGAGVYCRFSNAVIINCTIVNNTATTGGGGVYSDTAGNPTITNCIIWGNSPDQISGTATVNYSDVQGGFSGTDNINIDPNFVDAGSGNYHLMPDSNCTDTGDPAFVPEVNETDIDGDVRVLSGRVEMGADEFTGNVRPIADAGPYQVMSRIPALVTLDGSGSYDPDASGGFTYQWSQVAGPAVTLSDANAVEPNFVPTLYDTYRFKLVVNDGVDDSLPDTVTIEIINHLPVADAGPDQAFSRTLQLVTLDGSGSYDPDPCDVIVSYHWSQTGGPAVTLSDANAVEPNFVPTQYATYVFSLIVNDGLDDSLEDDVTIEVINHLPVADAGPNQVIGHIPTFVTLDGSGSYDPDPCDVITYYWTQQLGPTVTLSDANAVEPDFVATAYGTYEFELAVNDGLDSSSDTVTIEITNNPPVADAGPDQSMDYMPLSVTLDGSGSYDPDANNVITYHWTQTDGSAVTLSDANAVGPTFTPTVYDTYEFQLEVSDGLLDGSDSVVVLLFEPVIYYMATNGSDSNPGTIAEPWATLEYSLTQLSPGDILYLRGGTYYETDISVNTSGTALQPIKIQSYPGERAVLDGSYTYFRDAPNSEWELVNPSINLYRSVQTFPDVTPVGAWLLDYDVQLIEYTRTSCIEATTYIVNGTGYYCGPGIQYRNSRIYIRLEHIDPNTETDEQGNPLASIPPDPNANNCRIAVYRDNDILDMTSGPSYLLFKDLDLVHSRNTAYCTNAHHIEFDGCYIKHGINGINVARSGNHTFEIHHCEFNNGIPHWIYWEDVKHDLKPAYNEFQSFSVIGFLPYSNVHHNLFRDIFDGLRIYSNSNNLVVTDNTFIRSHDDAINIEPDMGGNVEIARNLMRHCFTGIGLLPSSDSIKGQIYIHHNIIDTSRLQHSGRPGGGDTRYWVWGTGATFAAHGGWDTYYLKFYNNTCVARRNGRNTDMGPRQVYGSSQKYVFNNVFYAVNNIRLLSEHLEIEGSHYDGDVFWQPEPNGQWFFEEFGDGGNYNSLADFRASSGTDWEVNGLEIDPGLDINAIDVHNYDPNQMWELYRPTNSLVFTEGASYQGLNWPGTQDIDYRGALPPDGPDLDHSGQIDWDDLDIFVEHWPEQNCIGPFWCEGVDIDKSGFVDLLDYRRLADYWMQAAP